jgi:hypothetical protein
VPFLPCGLGPQWSRYIEILLVRRLSRWSEKDVVGVIEG